MVYRGLPGTLGIRLLLLGFEINSFQNIAALHKRILDKAAAFWNSEYNGIQWSGGIGAEFYGSGEIDVRRYFQKKRRRYELSEELL
jgi:hypothetical protein